MTERLRQRALAPTVIAVGAFVVALLAGAGARAEVTATHDTIIHFDGRVFPRLLPRKGTTPIGVMVEGHLKARKGREPAALTGVDLEIHKAAGLSSRGIPVCDIALIDPASTAQALAACPGAQLGYGRVRAHSDFPAAPDFNFFGHVTVFNGRLEDGRRAILGHVFNPILHVSVVFPLMVSRQPGEYRTKLTAQMRIGRWTSITDFKLVLNRTYRRHGKRRGFLNAGCPAPRGFTFAVSPVLLGTLHFADGSEERIPVVGTCEVAG